MRILDVTVYSQYFRFVVEEDKAEDDASYGRPSFSVIYDNERVNVTCNCEKGINCEHAAYVHEMLSIRSDQNLKGTLLAARTPSAQVINDTTISRIRGAFAREWNMYKGVVGASTERGGLGWQGEISGGKSMRVMQRTVATFSVSKAKDFEYENEALVVVISSPQCQNNDCARSTAKCMHVEAVEEALKDWRRNGYIQAPVEDPTPTPNNPMYTYVTDARPVRDALDALMRMQSDQIRAQLRNAMLGIDLGREDESKIAYYTNADNTNATLTTSAAPGTEAKLSPDIEKVIKALNEPKPKKPPKPPKPRTRFTEIDL